MTGLPGRDERPMAVGALEPRVVAPVAGRWGILGGTFDPIHHGHLAIAEAAREALGLERVLFVPARQPPHRPNAPGASAEDRAAMVSLAIRGEPAFTLSRLELDREGPSYTVDTLTALAAVQAADRDAARSVVHPLGRGVRRVPDLARGRARPRPVPSRRPAPRRPPRRRTCRPSSPACPPWPGG